MKKMCFRNLHATLHGTDCKIVDPAPFSSDWYIDKFHGPGLRCEVAVSISCCEIFWTNFPYPCGHYLDQKCFNIGL